jgi:capsular exopolysaccharide synthesis family protein
LASRFGLEAGKYFLFVGRLAREKRVHDLIAAYKAVQPHGISLVIVGIERKGDSYGDELRTQTKDQANILFTGAIYGEELYEIYSNAFVYVLPSHTEGLPLSLLEAMSFGCCCIGSDIEANVEALDGKGLLFPVGNVEALAKCMSQVVTYPDKARKIGMALKGHALKNYTWEQVTEKFLTFYSLALHARTPQEEAEVASTALEGGALIGEQEGVIVTMSNESKKKLRDPGGDLYSLQKRAGDAMGAVFQPAMGQAYTSPPRELPIRQYWQAVLHNALPITLIALLGLLLMLGLASLLTPSYVAKTTIKIETPSRVLNYGIETDDGHATPTDEPVFLNTQFKMLRSRDLAAAVIDKLKIREELMKNRTFKPVVYQLLDPLTGAAKSLFSSGEQTGDMPPSLTAENIFLDRLGISPVKNSRIIDIFFTSQNPETARKTVQSIAETFVEKQYQARRETAEKARQFLDNQLDDARSQLQKSEMALVDYARKNNIVDTNAEEPIIAKNLADISKAYYAAKEARIRSQTQFNNKDKVSGELSIDADPIIQEHKKELGKLQNTYLSNLELFKPSYPAMVALKQQIDEREHLIEKQSSRLRTNASESMRASFQAAGAEEKKLADELKLMEKKLLDFRNDSIGYAQLKRDVETSRNLYEGLLQRLREIGVAETAQIDNVTVVEKAFVADAPTAPKYSKYGLLGLLAGLLSSILYVILREGVRPKVRNLQDIQDISGEYPILASLPYARLPASGYMGGMFGPKPLAGWLDALRYLKVSLSINNQGKFPQIIHVTSPLPGEGKSTTAVSLALTLAQSGKKVLLIDADLRKPTVHKRLNLPSQYGLTHYLADIKEDGTLVNKIEGIRLLFAISAGPSVSDPVEMLSSVRFQTLLERSRNLFDHIIIDAPPVLAMADSLVLANRADGTILIVANDRSTKQELRTALEVLEKSRGKILGIVQNMVPSGKSAGSGDYSDGRDMLVLATS